MRSTGALSYDVVMASAVDLKASLGRGLAFMESGDVEGGLVLGGNKAHTWHQTGMDPFIRDNWDAIRDARVVTEFKVNFGPGDALAVIATVIGIPVALFGMALGLAWFSKNHDPCGVAEHEEFDPHTGGWVQRKGVRFVPKGQCPSTGTIPPDR